MCYLGTEQINSAILYQEPPTHPDGVNLKGGTKRIEVHLKVGERSASKNSGEGGRLCRLSRVGRDERKEARGMLGRTASLLF